MNRRGFLASLFVAPAAALAAAAKPEAKPEVVCAWCNGTGRREYRRYHPVRDVVYLIEAPCDACLPWNPAGQLTAHAYRDRGHTFYGLDLDFADWANEVDRSVVSAYYRGTDGKIYLCP